jgi:small subunit ribosomal protein S1
LAQDPLSDFMAAHPKGSIVTGTITEVDARGAVVHLDDEVSGYIRASDIARDRVEDARSALSEGAEVEARMMGLDRKNRMISLSIKAKEEKEEKDAVRSYAESSERSGTTSLGDLLKEQIDAGDEGS